MKTSNKLLLGLLAVILLATTIVMIVTRVQIGKSMTSTHRNPVGQMSEQRQVGQFNQIEIEGKIKVSYTPGTSPKITVSDDSSMVKLVVSEVKEGKLYLYTREEFDRDEPILVNVVTDSINDLKLSKGGVFETMQPMKVAKLNAEASQGAVFAIEGDFNSLIFDINSGCVVNLKGKSRSLEVNSSAGCVFNAGDMPVDIGSFSASAGAIMNVNVTGEVSVNANAGSIIKCSGNPKTKNINVNSGAQFMD
jgi:hypothetical protein